MLIDSAIHKFINTYDREAIQSIDELCRDKINERGKIKFKLFNLNEAFDKFTKLIDHWGSYQVKILVERPTEFTEDEAKIEVEAYIDKLIKDKDVKCQDLNSFIESYLIGIKKLSSSIDKAKKRMLSEKVTQQNAAYINEMADRFISNLDKYLTEGMDRLLIASGYKTKKFISGDYKRQIKQDDFII